MKTRMVMLVALLMMATSWGQSAEKRKGNYNTENGLAIQGYDPVAYFKGNAVKGKKEWVATYEGITYRFATAANKEAFIKNPASYEPQYGGWCAYAMGSYGKKVEVDPETFKIVDGKLYLFYNAYFNNTLKSWNEDEPALKKKADLTWKKTIDK